MVVNFPLACNVCGCKIRMRYQVSEDKCPVNFLCPNCKTTISGTMQTIWHYGNEDKEKFPWHYNFQFNNATKVENDDCEDCEFVMEVSSDLLVSNIKRNEDSDLISPFIRCVSKCGNKITQTSRFYNFLSRWNKEWNDIKVNLDLCHNEMYDTLLKRFPKTYDKIFPRDINAILTTHQQLINFCNKILPKDTLHEFIKLNNRIITLKSQQPENFEKFTSIFDLTYVKDNERKLLHLIKSFIDMYPLFLPVFTSLSFTDVNGMGISTLNFEKLKSFYHDSYELILHILPQIIALNNISTRNDINNFMGNIVDFESKINSYTSKYKIYDDLLDRKEKFSWLITDRITNHIRNSIGHFNYEESPIDQTITFTDKHKGKINTFTKTLLEVARDCIYMFYSLINLLELNYDLLKILSIDSVKASANG